MKKFSCKNNQQGVTLIELLIAVLILGLIMISINNFLSQGVKSWQKAPQQLKAKREIRKTLWQDISSDHNKIGEDLQKLTGVSEADAHSISIVLANHEFYTDIDNNGLFDPATEAIIFDSNGNRLYDSGETLLYSPSIPGPGTFLATFSRRTNHVDNGPTLYRYDNGETVIIDINDNGLYDDPGDTFIMGTVPANGTVVVPFGDTVRYYLLNREIIRTINGGSPETLADNISNFDFKYYQNNGTELTAVPLNPTDLDKIFNIEIAIGLDNDNDGLADSHATTLIHPRHLDTAYGGK